MQTPTLYHKNPANSEPTIFLYSSILFNTCRMQTLCYFIISRGNSRGLWQDGSSSALNIRSFRTLVEEMYMYHTVEVIISYCYCYCDTDTQRSMQAIYYVNCKTTSCPQNTMATAYRCMTQTRQILVWAPTYYEIQNSKYALY